MNLNKIYNNVNKKIDYICINSKNVKPNSLFVAIGDGEKYIDEAIKNGATCIMSKNHLSPNIDTIIVDDPNIELAYLASSFYHHPSLNLSLNGITGTDGKTTTATIFKHLLGNSGYIGTNGINYKDLKLETKNTTPNALVLNEVFSNMVKENIEYCIMEISSHSITNNRVINLLFDSIIFTNLSHEHLDFHHTMEEYFDTKMSIFKNLRENGIAIINNDDFYGQKLISCLNCKIITYGIDNYSDIMAKNIKKYLDHITFDIVYKDILFTDFYLSIGCIFNVYNALGAIAGAIHHNIPMDIIKQRLKKINQIDGRVMNLTINEPYNCIVDFAHTPNALFNLLNETKEFTKKNLIIVFGCGGNKDASKRPIMGSIASTMADFVIFTSDDPLNEKKEDIINQMISYVDKNNYLVILDRKKAIEMAIKISNYGDTILITGKGLETYYYEDGKVFPYSDYDEAIKNLKKYKNYTTKK